MCSVSMARRTRLAQDTDTVIVKEMLHMIYASITQDAEGWPLQTRVRCFEDGKYLWV